MNDTHLDARPALTRDAPGAVLGYLSRNNVLYLLSALLMLVGCFLVFMPKLFNYRRLYDLLVLIAVINVYEFLVIAVLAFVARRAPKSRECSMLLLVLVLFMLDATFTINASIPIFRIKGGAIALVSLVLALGKLHAVELGMGRRVFRGMRTFYITALVFLYTFQYALMRLRTGFSATREWVSMAIWLGLAAVTLLLLISRLRDREGADRPWYMTAAFRRVAAVMALAMLALHVVGQSWVHGALRFAMPAPFLFALLAVLPVLFRVRSTSMLFAVRITSAAVIALALILFTLDSNPAWWRAQPLFTPVRVSLACGALLFMAMFFRELTAGLFHAACGLTLLAIITPSGAGLVDYLAAPTLATALACVPVLLVWIVFTRRYIPALAGSLGVLFMILRAAALRSPEMNLGMDMLCYGFLTALLLSLALGYRPKVLGTALAACLAASMILAGLPLAAPDEVRFWIVTGALVMAAGLTRRNVYLYASVAYLFAMDLRAIPLPSEVEHWGAIAVALAFAVFGAAFWVTHRRLRGGGISGDMQQAGG